MKTKVLILWLMVFSLTIPASAQKADRKKARMEQRADQEKKVTALMSAKEFVFTAQRAFPQGYKSIDLTANPNFTNFQPELIEGAMPFFGRGYSIPYGGDAGLKFKGKPESFTISETRQGFAVKAVVKGSNDLFQISLMVSSSGVASMTITTNNRSSISYNGKVEALKKEELNE